MHQSSSGPIPSARLAAIAFAAAGVLLMASCGSEAPEIPFDADREPPSADAESASTTEAPPSSSSSPSPSATAQPDPADEPDEPSSTTEGAEPVGTILTESAWQNVTGNLTALESDCGNLTMLAAPPGSDSVIAGVALNGLWTLDDPAAEWEQLGTAPGSDPIGNRPTNLLFDPARPETYWEAGIYADGVFRTDDDGVTFSQLGDLAHVDGVAVDLTDPERQTMVATIHERGEASLSEDGGQTWRSITATLPPNVGGGGIPYLLDSSTILLGTWLTDEPAIYRSTDRGETWESVYAGNVLEYAYPLLLPDASLLWVLHNGAGVVRSTDGGVTWEAWSFEPLITPIHDLGDGRLGAATADQVTISQDGGMTWTGVGPMVPFRPAGFAYAAGQRTFYISQSDCGARVLPDAVAALSLS